MFVSSGDEETHLSSTLACSAFVQAAERNFTLRWGCEFDQTSRLIASDMRQIGTVSHKSSTQSGPRKIAPTDSRKVQNNTKSQHTACVRTG